MEITTSIPCFLMIWIPYSTFSTTYETNRQYFLACAFSELANIFDFRNNEVSRRTLFEHASTFSYIISSILVSPKKTHIGIGAHGHVRKPGNHEHDWFSGFPKMKSNKYLSKMKQNIYGAFGLFFSI